MNYLDSVLPETVTNRPYNEKLIGHSRSIQLVQRRSWRVRFIAVSALLALALIGLWIGGQYGLGLIRSWK